jgi:hypothetical protein
LDVRIVERVLSLTYTIILLDYVSNKTGERLLCPDNGVALRGMPVADPVWMNIAGWRFPVTLYLCEFLTIF